MGIESDRKFTKYHKPQTYACFIAKVTRIGAPNLRKLIPDSHLFDDERAKLVQNEKSTYLHPGYIRSVVSWGLNLSFFQNFIAGFLALFKTSKNYRTLLKQCEWLRFFEFFSTRYPPPSFTPPNWLLHTQVALFVILEMLRSNTNSYFVSYPTVEIFSLKKFHLGRILHLLIYLIKRKFPASNFPSKVHKPRITITSLFISIFEASSRTSISYRNSATR